MKTSTLDNFKLVEKLGEGGMGEVFLGRDLMLEREVAIKSLHPELMARRDIVERFRTEAIALARLNHPNIAMLYSFVQSENQFFMVMEFVPGETLDARLRRQGAMHWAEAVSLICQILKGLEHAHRMGIIHRDIKPANIIINNENTPKLTDFGIARILETARLTKTGQLVGTLEYISPEQVEGKDTDSRSDIYSLGAVFYEMLTGQLPFKKNTDYELIKAQIEETPQALRKISSDIPIQLEKIVLRMLNKKPAKRYPSATSCLTELERILDSEKSDNAPRLESRPTFLKTCWKKYPGIIVLIIAVSIAGIIIALVLLDLPPVGRKSPPTQITIPQKPLLPKPENAPMASSEQIKKTPPALEPEPIISQPKLPEEEPFITPSSPKEKRITKKYVPPPAPPKAPPKVQVKKKSKPAPSPPAEKQQEGWSIIK